MNSLWDAVAGCGGAVRGHFHDREGSVAIADLETASCLSGRVHEMRGCSVLLNTGPQLYTAIALMELDGIARRLVLCTPELDAAQLEYVARMADADAVVEYANSASAASASAALPALRHVMLSRPTHNPTARDVKSPGDGAGIDTEWVLLTSGTTGTPKLVVHTLQSLAGALPRRESAGRGAGERVWSTFYDIRRYGGLQIFLRAVCAGESLVLSAAGETPRQFLERAGRAGVTHISGTPSHWRRALMSGAVRGFDPQYVRLSGEVADQPVLDALRAAFPRARIAHAFASTEAGVAFDVDDGRAGFPAAFVGDGTTGPPGVELKVAQGSLHIRSRRNARQYLGATAAPLAADDGFVDTGDLVELVGDRFQFRGRRGGVINVGGQKVFPEEVEAVLNADSRVRMSLVRARANPITGAVVVADIVLESSATVGANSGAGGQDRSADRADGAVVAGAQDGVADGAAAAQGRLDGAGPADDERIAQEILAACRQRLPAHKVPALLRVVPRLDLTPGGKLVRPSA